MLQFSEMEHGDRAECKEFTLRAILDRCEGAYADNTLRGYRADLQSFQKWCEGRNLGWLPASPSAIADYVASEIEDLAPSTVKRRLCAIKLAHKISDLPDPTLNSAVFLAVRRAARRKLRKPVQAAGLSAEILRRILDAAPDTLAGRRDAALISVGYDTLCRSCELAALRVSHLQWSEEGDCAVLIPRSKGDQAGDGRIAWLSPATTDRLRHWIEEADIRVDFVFRSLHLGRVSETPLNTSSIRRLVKRSALLAGVEPGPGQGLSGHSMRVGAAQDMLIAGFDSLAIMQAGGWKSPNVLLRYIENAATRTLHQRRWASLIQHTGFD